MTPVGAGDWWDPDAGDDAPRAVSRPHVPPGAPRRPRPEPLLVDDPVHVGGLSPWWRVGTLTTTTTTLAAAAAAVTLTDLWWGALAATQAVTTAGLVLAAREVPVRVHAGRTGLEVSTGSGSRQVPWDHVRSARGIGGTWAPHPHETHLELDSGELVALPRRTPSGWVEAWRGRLGGGEPSPRLPQVWRSTYTHAPQAVTGLHNVWLLVLVVNLGTTSGALDLRLPVLLTVYTGVLWLLALVSSRVSPRAFEADEHGLRVPRWLRGHRFVPWTDVVDVRAKGRYDPEVVLDLGAAGTQEVLGPELERVREWWQLATGSPHPDAPGT